MTTTRQDIQETLSHEASLRANKSLILENKSLKNSNSFFKEKLKEVTEERNSYKEEVEALRLTLHVLGK